MGRKEVGEAGERVGFWRVVTKIVGGGEPFLV